MSIDWASFAFGAVVGPLAVFVGFVLFMLGEEALGRHRERKRLAQICRRCFCSRGEHNADGMRCPKPREHEVDHRKSFTTEQVWGKP